MEDLLQLDAALNPDEIMIRDSVRRFVDQDFMPLVQDAYEQGTFPQDIIPKLADLGLLGMKLPSEFGGSEAGYVAYGLACQELERGDSGLRSFVSVQSSLCMYPIWRYGSDEQKQQYLPQMAQGKVIGCFGLTEPDIGSNPASMKTTAKKTDGGWVLNGSKMWITNATQADVAIVWANTEEGIRGFLVDTKSEGFSADPIHHKLSMRASDTGGLSFQDCFVPDDHYLPGSERGIGAPLSCLTQARYGIAWGAMGAAAACLDYALDYTQERKQFDKPIASFQLVQKDLADMFVELSKAQWLNLQVGRLAEQDQLRPEMVSLIKLNGAREALNIARKARNLLGGNGISLEYHVMRHMNNLETVFTYEGTDNIHHLVLGRYLTGISAFE